MLQRADDHIRMSAVYDLLPSACRRRCGIFGDILVLLVLVPIVWLGWETARNLDIMISISLGVPLSIFAYPVPIAGALMMVYTVALLVGRLSGREPEPSNADFGDGCGWADCGTSSSSSSRSFCCACRSRSC